ISQPEVWLEAGGGAWLATDDRLSYPESPRFHEDIRSLVWWRRRFALGPRGREPGERGDRGQIDHGRAQGRRWSRVLRAVGRPDQGQRERSFRRESAPGRAEGGRRDEGPRYVGRSRRRRQGRRRRARKGLGGRHR